jgi:hypothetical protein
MLSQERIADRLCVVNPAFDFKMLGRGRQVPRDVASLSIVLVLRPTSISFFGFGSHHFPYSFWYLLVMKA